MTEILIHEQFPSYEICIGIEVHVQLNTRSKIFCTCPNTITKEPNSNICPVCTGYPGVLPVLNQEVVRYAILMGLATNSIIDTDSVFARKHYFYPDLPKNFQITQAEKPICQGGYVEITTEDNKQKKINLVRIHIEEDAGKNIHSASTNESFVDLNRTGTPLLEIVSQPDISSAQEARNYLKTLRNIVLHLGIGTGNMEDGALRADINISARKKGAQKLGTKVELKNINSFKFVADAIDYEAIRQIQCLESGQIIHQETRSWDQSNKQTFVMRSKEEAADYRYFSEPDLPTLHLEQSYIDTTKKSLPELPQQRFTRYTSASLSPYEATILVDDIELAQYFDRAYKLLPSKTLVNWLLRDVIGYLKEHKITVKQFGITSEHFAELIELLDNGHINATVAHDIFAQAAETKKSPKALVSECGLTQITDEKELESIVQRVIEQNAQQVLAYKNGNAKLFGFLVGQAMKETKGRASPQIINQLLKKLLDSFDKK